MKSPLIRRSIKVLLIASACVVGYLGIGWVVYFWKENVRHYASGAKSDLLAIHTMQENYRSDHGGYAGNFSDLGVPLGARLQGDELIWDGPYRIRFNLVVRDQGGSVVHYTIDATPDKTHAHLPRIEIDDAGILNK